MSWYAPGLPTKAHRWTDLDGPQRMDSPDRAEFFAGLQPGGKYDGIVGIYRHNISADYIGIFDKELVAKLPASVKWIAHNGAGYDQIDVAACKERGEH